MVRRVAPAPTDEQLAAAEETDLRRRRDLEAQREDDAEQERLALAGEPESEEAIRKAAVRASASVMSSTPMPPEEPEDEVGNVERDSSRGNSHRRAKPKRTPPSANSDRSTDGADSQRPARRAKRFNPTDADGSVQVEKAPRVETEEDDDELRIREEKLAWKLMDTAYKKWRAAAMKDLSKANRGLALDLGGDAALLLRSGLIRMADLHSTIEKLTASAKAGKDNQDGEENFDDELEALREALRDGK